MFTHDTNDKITIGSFVASLDDFLLLEPSYRLPDGALWQFYVPDVKRLIGYGLYQRDEGPSWRDGDIYLANETIYATMQPDTSPNVAGFERDLVSAFDGNYLAINSLYSGWPLFKDALEAEQWSVADLLLSNAYANDEITTDTYTAIIAAARQNYIPMALQGRPGLVPLNILDVARAIVVLDLVNKTDSLSVSLSDIGRYLVPVPTTSDGCAVQISTETAALILPITLKSDDVVVARATEGVPVIA